MTLAGILILSMLAPVGGAAPRFALQASPPQSAQPSAEAPQETAPSPQPDSKSQGEENKPQGQPADSQTSSPPTPDASKPVQEPPAEPKETKPEQAATPEPPAGQASEPGKPANPPATDQKKAPACSPKAAAKKTTRKPKSGPPRKVVREGGTSDAPVELAPSVSQQQASSQKQDAGQLIAATDEDLKKIAARQLKPSEQETVNEIHNYLDQARAALKAGDSERSRNLAFKAHLLSADLLPH